jgi:hypothetical protein
MKALAVCITYDHHAQALEALGLSGPTSRRRES